MSKLSEENLMNIRRVESIINRNLFLICTIITCNSDGYGHNRIFQPRVFFSFPNRFLLYRSFIYLYCPQRNVKVVGGEKRGETRRDFYLFLDWINYYILCH